MTIRICRLVFPIAGLVAVLTAGFAPRDAAAQLASCNGAPQISYVSGVNNPQPVPPGMTGDDIVRVRLDLVAGIIQPSPGTLTVHSINFDLDCVSGTTGNTSPCTDDGAVIQYQGDATITTTCSGITWTSGHAASTSPNEIAFTPSSPIVIPSNTDFCELEFDIKVVGRASS